MLSTYINNMDDNKEEIKTEVSSESVIKQEENKNVEIDKAEELKSDSEKQKKKSKKVEVKKSFARECMEWVVCVLSAFALAVFIKYFVFTPTQVKMSSMYPTIEPDERVFVNRLVRTFKLKVNRGDIITFEAPNNNDLQYRESGDFKASYSERTGWSFFVNNVLEMGPEKVSYIKRVVGLAGDKIQLKDGFVYLNGELLDETSYLPDGTVTSPTRFGLPEEFVVPEGYIFAMGDNRRGSKDCRAFGCVPVSKIEGKVLFRIWPLTKFGGIGKAELTAEDVSNKLKY